MNLKFLVKNFILLLFKRSFAFEFDRIPLTAKNLSTKKIINLFKISLNRFFKISKPMGFPYMAHIDPASICNLSCYNCPVTNYEDKSNPYLSFENFKNFIDGSGDYLLYIILWSWGEPLLNRVFCKMTAYAREKNILTVTSSNLNRLSVKDAEALVEHGPDALIVALDGVKNKTYSKLRKGGDLNKVKENLQLLLKTRQEKGVCSPFINLRMVVSSENENEVEEFKKIGRDLKMDMISIKAYSTRQSGILDKDIDRHYSPRNESLRWYRYQEDFSPDKKAKKYDCKFPWTKPMLFADGTIVSCEFDFDRKLPFGDINNQSFKEIWFGEAAKKFRQKFHKNRDDVSFCKDCVYDYKVIPGCVLYREFPGKE